MATRDMWEEFRERDLPRYERILARILGREVPVDIEWSTLPNDPGRDESLGYDLEMLARGLEAVEPPSVLFGIERIRMRHVRGPADCRLALVRGTLHVDFRWEGTGRFSVSEVAALLRDGGEELWTEWVEEVGRPGTGGLAEVRRNRFPSLLDSIREAMGPSVPLRVEWAGLGGAADAPERLVYQLRELARALRVVGKKTADAAVGDESVRRRALERGLDRSSTVSGGIASIVVLGGTTPRDAVCRLHSDVLEVTVFQGGEGRYSHLPGVRARDLEQWLKDALDLEAGPLLRQIMAEDFETARAHLPKHLDELVGKLRGLGPREKFALRRLLSEGGLALTVDWDGLTAHEASADRIRCLRRLQTGPYNYNCDYGELFKTLMYALDEAFTRSHPFPARFLQTVREVRYEFVIDPDLRELLLEDGVLILRQCLLEPEGTFADYGDLATQLITLLSSRSTGEGVRAGPDIPVVVSSGFSAAEEIVRRRLVEPVRGAFALLAEKGAYARLLPRLLTGVRIEPAPTPEGSGCALDGQTLVVRGRPADGAEGCLAGDDLIRAIDDALALRARAAVDEIDREEHGVWQRMLRERFERDVPIEADWEAFLADPERGGNRLIPLNVNKAGAYRLIYALTRFMDSDEEFRAWARMEIHGLLVVPAPTGARAVELEGPVLVHRCHDGSSLKGFFTIDDIQMRLAEIFETSEDGEDSLGSR